MTMSAYEKTASVRLEADGAIVFKNLAGQEFEIDVKRTQLVRAVGGTEKTVDYITEMLDRAMMDALILSNLVPMQRTAAKRRG